MSATAGAERIQDKHGREMFPRWSVAFEHRVRGVPVLGLATVRARGAGGACRTVKRALGFCGVVVLDVASL